MRTDKKTIAVASQFFVLFPLTCVAGGYYNSGGGQAVVHKSVLRAVPSDFAAVYAERVRSGQRGFRHLAGARDPVIAQALQGGSTET